MKDVYIYLILGHRSFTTGKIVIVSVPNYSVSLTTYEREAKLKACQALNLKESEVVVLDYRFLGDDVTFIT